jgi:hypothetical protein
LSVDYLARHYPWDLLMVQVHAPDGLNHEALNHLSPHWKRYDPGSAERAWQRFRTEYGTLDAMVGQMVASCASEETLVVVVSDHAAIPTTRMVWVGQALVDAGLLVYREDDAGRWVPDWTRTRVVLGDHPLAENVWVNLKGRDPDGIVEPGTEYEAVREAVLHAFYALRDPETGLCPVALALRKEDASFLGQWGNTCGRHRLLPAARLRLQRGDCQHRAARPRDRAARSLPLDRGGHPVAVLRGDAWHPSPVPAQRRLRRLLEPSGVLDGGAGRSAGGPLAGATMDTRCRADTGTPAATAAAGAGRGTHHRGSLGQPLI